MGSFLSSWHHGTLCIPEWMNMGSLEPVFRIKGYVGILGKGLILGAFVNGNGIEAGLFQDG